MYNIYNKSNIYYLWNIKRQKTSLIGDERDLINFIARNFRRCWDCFFEPTNHYHNPILDSFACNANEIDKEYQIFDGYGRCINPKIYEKEALKLYFSKYKDKDKKFYWRKKYKNTVRFRYDPIPYSRKRRGGPRVKSRRIKHLKAMYANPEYKGFNRGSSKDCPLGWWDDWCRHTERNWKSQRQHQWKG